MTDIKSGNGTGKLKFQSFEGPSPLPMKLGSLLSWYLPWPRWHTQQSGVPNAHFLSGLCLNISTGLPGSVDWPTLAEGCMVDSLSNSEISH